MQVKDIAPKLRRAIMLAREAGLVESAAELETRAFAAYTTSSEWLGAVGDAIRRFRRGSVFACRRRSRSS